MARAGEIGVEVKGEEGALERVSEGVSEGRPEDSRIHWRNDPRLQV